MADGTEFNCCNDLTITVGIEGIFFLAIAETGGTDWHDGWTCVGFVSGFTYNEATGNRRVPCRYNPAHHVKQGRPEITWSIEQLYTDHDNSMFNYKDDTLDFKIIVNKDGDETTPGTPDEDEVIFVYNAGIENISFNFSDDADVTLSADGFADRISFEAGSSDYSP